MRTTKYASIYAVKGALVLITFDHLNLIFFNLKAGELHIDYSINKYWKTAEIKI